MKCSMKHNGRCRWIRRDVKRTKNAPIRVKIIISRQAMTQMRKFTDNFMHDVIVFLIVIFRSKDEPIRA